MSNYIMDEIIKDQVKFFNSEKEKLIKQRLIERGFQNVVDDLEFYPNRRFPLINRSLDTKGNECYYVNDGSVEGHLLITFFPIETNFKDVFQNDNKGLKFNIQLKYQ